MTGDREPNQTRNIHVYLNTCIYVSEYKLTSSLNKERHNFHDTWLSVFGSIYLFIKYSAVRLQGYALE